MDREKGRKMKFNAKEKALSKKRERARSKKAHGGLCGKNAKKVEQLSW